MARVIPLLAAAAIVLAACSALASQTQIVIGDFEDGTTQGWSQNGFRPMSVVVDPSGKSSYALAVDWGGSGGFDWSIKLDGGANPDLFLLANGSGPQMVEFDIYWDPPNDWSGDGWIHWGRIAYNYDGGWIPIKAPTSPGGISDRSYHTRRPYGEQHPEWDFIANGTPLANGTSFAQLFVATNTGDSDPLNPITRGTFYIDNITITVIPEPSTALLAVLACLGMSGFCCGGRRREAVS